MISIHYFCNLKVKDYFYIAHVALAILKDNFRIEFNCHFGNMVGKIHPMRHYLIS